MTMSIALVALLAAAEPAPPPEAPPPAAEPPVAVETPPPSEPPKDEAPAPVAAPVPPAAPTKAVEPAKPAEPPAPKKPADPGAIFSLPDGTPFEMKLTGAYSAWLLNQHGFLLGADNPMDDADYVVQVLRMNFKAGTPMFGAVARLDAGQGWWGVDNSPDVTTTPTTNPDGTVGGATTYNPYKLFGDKDTNYTVHFDHAYAYIAPPLSFPFELTIGRQYFGLGHKLVLDEDYDGVNLKARPIEMLGVNAFFALVSEGAGSYKAPVGALMNDDGPFKDAMLVGGAADLDLGPVKLGAFGAYYWDDSDGYNSSYLPQGYGYLDSRFKPNVGSLTTLGLTADGTIPLAEGLKVEAEVDFLIGKDYVVNVNHAGGLLDINNGDLMGWNVYLKADQKLLVGPVALEPGLTFGLGSGDDDPTSGPGNVNKIQTMGFFPLTNVWEDSVMPDIAGISPQGLGSPVSRGYREFENTLALQGRCKVTPWKPLGLEVSYTFLRGVQPIHGFDATGTPTGTSSQDIGHEIDANLTAKILPNVTYEALFGVFLPGQGAGLLINGGTSTLEPAWEVKETIAVTF